MSERYGRLIVKRVDVFVRKTRSIKADRKPPLEKPKPSTSTMGILACGSEALAMLLPFEGAADMEKLSLT